MATSSELHKLMKELENIPAGDDDMNGRRAVLLKKIAPFVTAKIIMMIEKVTLPQNVDSSTLEFLSRSVYDFGLGTRIHNCLHTNDIKYVGDLLDRLTWLDLRKTPNFGQKSKNKILEEVLDPHGLIPGMTITNWQRPTESP